MGGWIGRKAGGRLGWFAALVVLAVATAAVALAAATTARATPDKPYTANVHQALNTPGSFTLTVTNDPHASQSLGSANFTPPAGFTLGSVSNITDSGFDVSVVGNVVEFRANSSATALGAGESVSADVTVTSGIDGCTSATWIVEAKQSNDFSGAPGNGMQLDAAASDLTPLGSFVLAPIETVVTQTDGSMTHVPQIVADMPAPIRIEALDTCGNPDSDYSGATLDTEPGYGLANATFSSLTWSNAADGSRVGSATVTPVDVEVGDQFTVSDPTTGISATSFSTDIQPTFDVVQKLCASPGQTCTWTNNNGITATSTVPNDGKGEAMGLGYKPFADGVSCGTSSTPVGDLVQIDPFKYSGPYTVVLTYSKSLVGNGPASGLIICKSTDTDWLTWNIVPPCGHTPTAECADVAKISGGNYQVTLYLNPGDPGSGGFR